MRYMKMNLGVWAFSALALLASCSEKDIVANVTIPDELEQAQTNGAGLESHSYGISFEVNSDSEWKIELDEAGEEMRSVAFAQWLQKRMNSGIRRLVLMIGGPYGFSEEVYNRANAKISLSKMTFSHQIVRAIFTEQLYRAFTILKGEPYHHE